MIKEKEEVKSELQKSIYELKKKKEEVTLLSQEESRLQKIIQDSDKERAKLKKELKQVKWKRRR